MNVLEVRDLAFGHGRRVVGAGVGFAVAPGEVLCLLGPNGSGKTTLFRTVLGLLPPLAGEVRVAGEPVAAWDRARFARMVGYVPQAQTTLFPFTVEQMVLMGRTAHLGPFATPSARDRDLARHHLAAVGIAALAGRVYTEISGGERQLALIARALAQEPALLVMDEPTASLDYGNQLRVLDHVAALRRQGIALLMSTHQPEHALEAADRVMLLKDGEVLASGPAPDVVTPMALAHLYGVHPSRIVLPTRAAPP